MVNIGFRIFKQVNRPGKELVDQFSGIPSSNIGDVINRFNCMAANLRPVNQVPLLGPAVTARVRPGDNLLFHQALDSAQPGDVIVIDGQGDLVNALVGENLALWAIKRGIAGIVVDGGIRDVEVLRELDFPIYAAGITPGGTYKHGAGEVNVPVCCGRVVVMPGDILVGDADGVVVVPQQAAAGILAKAQAKRREETGIKEAIAAGNWIRPACSDEALRGLGCEIIDGVYK